jgi:hypothetical protein
MSSVSTQNAWREKEWTGFTTKRTKKNEKREIVSVHKWRISVKDKAEAMLRPQA